MYTAVNPSRTELTLEIATEFRLAPSPTLLCKKAAHLACVLVEVAGAHASARGAWRCSFIIGTSHRVVVCAGP